MKLLKIIQSYLQMCKMRRQKGQVQSQSMMLQIKQNIRQIFEMNQQIIKSRELNSHHEFIKVIQQIMKYLDIKYKKQIIDKKYLHNTFQHHLTDEYRMRSNIKLRSLLGNVQVNNNGMNEIQSQKQNTIMLNSSFRSFCSSPSKRNTNGR